ncbi:MAG: RNA polymerase sigma factor [Candidatus Dormibacteria bacterium]
MQKLSKEELEQERHLLELARTDRSAFGELYDRYFDAIFSFALHQTGDRELAQDVTAATFQKALEELDRYQWRGVPYGAWLYRVAASVIARSRRRAPWLELAESEPAGGPGPEETWLTREESGGIREMLAQLPAEQRQALVLKFAGQMRNREIGDVMGRSEGAVKQLLFRGTQNLRRVAAGRHWEA